MALTSVLAAILLTGLKLTVGLMTNSLGILAEALHSALDLGAALITLAAVKISAKPADSDHTYGHGKFENLSALAETLLLLVTSGWIIYEATQRLFLGASVEIKANFWAFAVVLVSIVVDYGRSRALLRVARRYNSQALYADALHFSTDIWSSLVVLGGLAAVQLAQILDVPWMVKADAVAAMGVALIVVWVSIRLALHSVADLLDAIPRDLQQQVTKAVMEVPGVQSVSRVRLRRSGPDTFADVTLTVWRGEQFEKAHEIADRAEEAVKEMFPQVDVVIHVEPGD